MALSGALIAETVYPTPEEITRNKIMDAAIRCIDQKGLERFRIGDIADEMGMARQTIYNYFSSKNDLLAEVFEREGMQLAQRTASFIENIDKLEDKFVKAFLFIYEAFPKNVVLGHVARQGGQLIREIGISRQNMEAFGAIAFEKVFEQHPLLHQQSQEISEMMIRLVMSLLMLPDQQPRTIDELEAFVRRRLIPGLGLDLAPVKGKQR